jgi:hypothetical protein
MEHSKFLHFLYTIENDIPDYSPTFKNISKKLKASGYKFSYKLSMSENGRFYIAYKKPIDPDSTIYSSKYFEIVIDVDEDIDFGRIAARYICDNDIRISSFCEYHLSGELSIKTFIDTLVDSNGYTLKYEKNYRYQNKTISYNATYPYTDKLTLKIKYAMSYMESVVDVKGVLYGTSSQSPYIEIDQETLLNITGIDISKYSLDELLEDFDNLINDEHYAILGMIYI